MALRVLPSVERVVIAYLRASTDIQALAATRVSTEIPSAPVWPLVTVTLVSGEERIARHLDASRLQVDAWGGTKDEADVLARTLRAVLLEMPDATINGAVVTDVSTLVAPRWFPDSSVNPPRPRYTADYAITVHP